MPEGREPQREKSSYGIIAEPFERIAMPWMCEIMLSLLD